MIRFFTDNLKELEKKKIKPCTSISHSTDFKAEYKYLVCFNKSEVLYFKKYTIVLLSITSTLFLQHLHQSGQYTPRISILFRKKTDIFLVVLTQELRQYFCEMYAKETKGSEMNKKTNIFYCTKSDLIFLKLKYTIAHSI